MRDLLLLPKMGIIDFPAAHGGNISVVASNPSFARNLPNGSQTNERTDGVKPTDWFRTTTSEPVSAFKPFNSVRPSTDHAIACPLPTHHNGFSNGLGRKRSLDDDDDDDEMVVDGAVAQGGYNFDDVKRVRTNTACPPPEEPERKQIPIGLGLEMCGAGLVAPQMYNSSLADHHLSVVMQHSYDTSYDHMLCQMHGC